MLISLGAERVTVLRVNVSAKMKKKRANFGGEDR